MKKVLLLLADGFEAVEASVFTDVLGWNKLEGNGTTQVVTAGLHDRLKCTWNFTVIPEVTLDSVKVEDYDALAGSRKRAFITMHMTPVLQDYSGIS